LRRTQDAAANGRLGSATYQRLLVAVLAKNVTYLLAFALVRDWGERGLKT
jgi:hypothetical protein